MADVMRELERLRPVYETGVLRLLLRQNAMLYVSLLRSTFDPLTGELPRETVEERFAQSLNALADAGEYAPREDQTFAEAAHQILADLTREGEGDYAWLANSHDAASHRFLYRLTARAHRAIHRLEAGICWINTWGESPAEMPVGGYKQSGVGRENGLTTLAHYTRIKSVQVELGDYASVF